MDNIPYQEAVRFPGIRETPLRKRLHDGKNKLQRQVVKMAEETFHEFRLPKNFAEKCIYWCKRSKLKREVKDMEKKNLWMWRDPLKKEKV